MTPTLHAARVGREPNDMLTTNPFDDDKLREECGIFGIWDADNAASFVALGLHALQHRGQEAAGITSFDGQHFHSHRAMGHEARDSRRFLAAMLKRVKAER